MKTVLCFGDSLTWGHDGASGDRHAFDRRWPNVLASELGEGAAVVTEALNGRTTAYDEHLAPCDRNGAHILPTLLHSHRPLDLVILFLGTNDLKPFTGNGARGAAMGMERLIQIVRSHPYGEGMRPPKILVVAPPKIAKGRSSDYGDIFDRFIEESASFSRRYEELANRYGCAFFDAGRVASPSEHDGVHLDAETTAAIGHAIAPIVRDTLNSTN